MILGQTLSFPTHERLLFVIAAALLLFGVLGLSLHLILRLVLERYVHQFTYKRISWTLKLEDVEWEGKTVTLNHELSKSTHGHEERTKVHIKAIGLAWRKAPDGRRWFGILADGVTAVMPRAHLARRLQPEPKQPKETSRTSHPKRMPRRIFRKIVSAPISAPSYVLIKIYALFPVQLQNRLQKAAKSIYSTLLRPIIGHLRTVVEASTSFIRLAIEFNNVHLEVTDLLHLRLRLLAGVQFVRNQGDGNFTAFLGLSNVQLSTSSASEQPEITAFKLAQPLLVRATTPLYAVAQLVHQIRAEHSLQFHGPVSIMLHFPQLDAGNSKQNQQECIVLHVSPLQSILLRLQVTLKENARADPGAHPTSKTARNISFIKDISIRVPCVDIVHAAEPDQQSTTELTTSIVGFWAILGVGQSFDGSSKLVHKPHKAFIGKNRTIPVSMELAIGSIRSSIDAGPQTSMPQQLLIDESRLKITSLWLPSSLCIAGWDRPILEDSHVIVEGSIGNLHIEAAYDELNRAVDALTVPTNKQGKKAQPSESALYLGGPPPVILNLTTGHSTIRLHGPQETVHTLWAAGEGDDGSPSAAWSKTDALCLDVPTLHLNVQTEYRGISLHRNDAQRRQARKEKRRLSFVQRCAILTDTDETKLKVSVDLDNTVPIASAPDQHEELAFSKPGSATLRSSILQISTDLNRHSSVYHTDLSFSSESAVTLALLSIDRPSQASDGLTIHEILHESAVSSRYTLSRYSIAKIGPLDMSSRMHWAVSQSADGSSLLEKHCFAGQIRFVLEEIYADICRPKVLSCLQDVIIIGSHVQKQPRMSDQTKFDHPSPAARPLIALAPINVHIFAAVRDIRILIAAPDPKNDPHVNRGLLVTTNLLSFDGVALSEAHASLANFPGRDRLRLPPDSRATATAIVAAHDGESAILLHTRLRLLQISPVADATAVEIEEFDEEPSASSPVPSNGNWEYLRTGYFDAPNAENTNTGKANLARLLVLPNPSAELTVRVSAGTASSNDSLDKVKLEVDIPQASIHFNAFAAYCSLIAASAYKTLLIKKRGSTASKGVREQMARPKPQIYTSVKIDQASIHFTLPHDTRLFVRAKKMGIKYGPERTNIALGSLTGAVPSPIMSSRWENLLHMHDWTITATPTAVHNVSLSIFGSTARLRIPFKYPLSHIIDNTSTLVKAIKQLKHQFVDGKFGSALNPKPEEPKKLPHIALNIALFIFEAQDDPFETRLNIIRRAGIVEQQAREDLELKYERQLAEVRQKSRSNHQDRHVERESRQRLDAHHSRGWVARIQKAMDEQARREQSLLRDLYRSQKQMPRDKAKSRIEEDIRPDEIPADFVARAKPLLRMVASGLHVIISPPHCGNEVAKVRDLMHKVGGMPLDAEYILWIPFHLIWRMKDFRVNLRDYPLPLMHVPPLDNAPADTSAHSWQMETDLVIAEEFPGVDSVRHVPCPIVEPDNLAKHRRPYAFLIPRSAMPTKMYGLPVIDILSHAPTRFCWGQSMQPAISDFTRVVDGITKPPPDPSEKIGFWDKLRLVAHGNVRVNFTGNVHFHLKGSRNPYEIRGYGAGYLKSWSGNVRFLINIDNPQRELFQIVSNRYYIGVPDLSAYEDSAASGTVLATAPGDAQSIPSSAPYSDSSLYGEGRDPVFVKIMGKLVNGVRWGMGFRFERACRDESCVQETKCRGAPFHRKCRLFDFINHWQVLTKSREGAYRAGAQFVDSFEGFRSDFIHFSISLTSPVAGSAIVPAASIGSTLHFSPLLMSHFWHWWSLFDSSMSLPVRTGPLFPSSVQASKKFGRHCATIKYRFDLEPLFISHMYRQEDESDWRQGQTTVLGLKCKTSLLKIDLHQREEESSVHRPEMNRTITVKHKKFYLAEVHSGSIDLRVVSGRFEEKEKADVIQMHTASDAAEDEDDRATFTSPKHTLTDEEIEWIDIDDFMDLGLALPNVDPDVQLHPVMQSRTFTYYRQPNLCDAAVMPDAEGQPQTLPARPNPIATVRTKFGNEASHLCLVKKAPDPVDVQISIAQERLQFLKDLYEASPADAVLPQLVDIHTRALEDELKHRLRRDEIKIRMDTISTVLKGLRQVAGERQTEDGQEHTHSHSYNGIELPLISSKLSSDFANWTNRLIVHALQVQIDNAARDILRKYYYSHKRRSAEAFQLTARAAKFIDDLAKAHASAEKQAESPQKSKPQLVSEDDDHAREPVGHHDRRIWAHQATRHSTGPSDDPGNMDPASDVRSGIPDEFDTNSNFLVILLRPQFLLSSDVDKTTRIVVTTLLTILRSYKVEDPSVRDDPINGSLLRRTYVELRGLQMFHPHAFVGDRRKDVFVPMEVLADSRIHPFEYDRVIPTTDVMLRYDKYNHLRISHRASRNAKVAAFNAASRMDEITVGVSRLNVSANKQQFSALFAVVADLILHSDPERRKMTEKLEALLLVTEFADISRRRQAINECQRNIRQRTKFLEPYLHRLNREAPDVRLEVFQVQHEMQEESDALAMQIEAIRQSQHTHTNKDKKTNASGTRLVALAHETTWYMNDSENRPFVKAGLRSTYFVWNNRADGSVSNQLSIENLSAYNCAPDHIFTEIVAKYSIPDGSKLDRYVDKQHREAFVVLMWNTMPAVGGISIIDKLEVHLHPLIVQLEKAIGQECLDYLAGDRSVKGGGFRRDDKHGNKQDPASPESKTGTKVDVAAPKSKNPQDRLRVASLKNSSSLSVSSKMSKSSSQKNLLRPAKSAESLRPLATLDHDTEHDYLPVDQMRERSRNFHSFITVHIAETIVCFSYRSLDKSSLLNVYGLTFRLTPMSYRNKVGSYRDVLELAKADFKQCLLSQSGSLLSQFITTARKQSNFARVQSTKVRKAGASLARKYRASENSSLSPLKRAIQADEDFDERGEQKRHTNDSVGELPRVDQQTPVEPMTYDSKINQLRQNDPVQNPSHGDFYPGSMHASTIDRGRSTSPASWHSGSQAGFHSLTTEPDTTASLRSDETPDRTFDESHSHISPDATTLESGSGSESESEVSDGSVMRPQDARKLLKRQRKQNQAQQENDPDHLLHGHALSKIASSLKSVLPGAKHPDLSPSQKLDHAKEKALLGHSLSHIDR